MYEDGVNTKWTKTAGVKGKITRECHGRRQKGRVNGKCNGDLERRLEIESR